MMIHPVRMNGVVIGVEQTYKYFEQMQERVVGFITAHCSVDRKELMRRLLSTDELANDTGSVLSAQEAVSCGIIDQIGSLSDALGYLHARLSQS